VQEQYADGGAYKFYYITIDQATRPQALKLLAEAAAGGPISTPACSGLQTLSRIAYTIAVDPNENPTTYRFNNYQQIISVTDANGQTTFTERDPFTNLVKSRTDASVERPNIPMIVLQRNLDHPQNVKMSNTIQYGISHQNIDASNDKYGL
jgi:YD repeat-containing protein